MIELITVILSIIVGFVQWYNEPEKVKKRNDHERDKELSNQDSIAISQRLSDGLDRMRIFNRKNRKSRSAE